MKTKLVMSGIMASIILNVVFAWFLFSIYQDNHELKKAIITEYTVSQERSSFILEQVLDERYEQETLVLHLLNANKEIYHARAMAGLGNLEANVPKSLGQKVNPERSVVYHALFEAIDGDLSDQTVQELEIYAENLSKLADVLSYQENLKEQDLKEYYNVLDRANELAEELFN